MRYSTEFYSPKLYNYSYKALAVCRRSN